LRPASFGAKLTGMSSGGLLRGALLALLIGSSAASAPRARLSDFDINRAEAWPDALAVCDLTLFLRTRPSLDADVILAPDPNSGWVRPLQGPRFLPPNLFHSRTVRQAYERLEAAGQIDRDSFARARLRYDTGMFASYRRANARDLAFLEQQSVLCGYFAQDIRERFAAEPSR
jgi:hypothetical protein